MFLVLYVTEHDSIIKFFVSPALTGESGDPVLAELQRRLRVGRDGDGVHAHRRARLLPLHPLRVRAPRLHQLDGRRPGLRGPRRRRAHPEVHATREVHSLLGRGAHALRHALRVRQRLQDQPRRGYILLGSQKSGSFV